MAALARIQGTDLFHFFCRQGKIKNSQVPGNPPRVGGFGQDNQSVLHLKAQDYLSHILAILLGQGLEQRLLQQSCVPMTQGLISFNFGSSRKIGGYEI